MTLHLGCIADDYTGASDLANTLTRCGLRTMQTIGVPADGFTMPNVDAVVVALKSRSIKADEAVAKSRAADRWLRGRGARHVMFKICSTFDSTDEGNIGPVMDALREDAKQPIALVTPAFPETGRTVYMGHLFVGVVPLNESPLKDHPLNPMHDANLVRVLARQSRFPVGLADRLSVAAGSDALRKRLSALAEQGQAAVIADAVAPEDLDVLGTVALDHAFSVGASGLGFGIARALVKTQPTVSQADQNASPVGGHIACLAGSCSQATLEQITQAEAIMPVLRLDPEKLLAGQSETAHAVAWAKERLGNGPLLIASSANAESVRAVQQRHGRDRAGHAIEQAMADIAEALVHAGVKRLVVAGGETSGAVVDRLKLPGFLVGEEIAAGVPVLRSVGQAEPMLLTLKSGNFGGRTFFADALGHMA